MSAGAENSAFVTVEGRYTGMGDADLKDALLLGAVIPRPGQLVTVKMTGPAAEVRAEQDRFRNFVESFRE